MAVDWGRVNTGLQTASPMLLGLSAQLMGRNDQGMMQGVAQMQQQAEVMKRKSAIDALKEEMGLSGPELALVGAMSPDAALGYMADMYGQRRAMSAMDELDAMLLGGGGGAPAGGSGLNMGPVQTGNLDDIEFREDWLAAMEGAPGIENFDGSAWAAKYPMPADVQAGIFAGESGGDYNALYGYSNRPGGRFENVRLTDMTVDQALEFAKPSGEYGQSVKRDIGRVATPMGAYQVVGTTLRAAKEGMGLTGKERMTPELQDAIGGWILQNQGTAAWAGYTGKRAPGSGTRVAQAGGGQADNRTQRALMRAMSDPNIPAAKRQFYAAEYERRFGAPQAVEGKAVGNNLVNPYTGEVIYEGSDDEDLPASAREYEYAKAQGFPGSFADFLQFKKGKGFEVRMPDGTVVSYGGAGGGDGGVQSSSPEYMLQTIEGILNDPALEMSTGIFSPLQYIPGTPQKRFGTRAEQLQGQAFLQAFESLKGGGQITEIEGQKATQAIGRLDTAQSAKDYREALNELKAILEAAIKRKNAGATGGAAPAATSAPDPLGLR